MANTAAYQELNESLVWLEMLRRLELAPEPTLEPLVREADELCRIISASIRTASGKAPQTGY